MNAGSNKGAENAGVNAGSNKGAENAGVNAGSNKGAENAARERGGSNKVPRTRPCERRCQPGCERRRQSLSSRGAPLKRGTLRKSESFQAWGIRFFALECAKGAAKRRLYARHGDPEHRTPGRLSGAFGLMLSRLPGLACAQMKYVETEQLRLIDFAGTDYLVPYATQSFVNALRAQNARFGYVPDGKVAVLVQDFSDSGNAVMLTAPRNRIFYDIAPIGLTFETFSPGERLYTFANHETVHFASG